ncbi:cytochrome C [Leptospira gomenensis]|uniref:Cytochrome C n=1 Tax=Leptospira gomenensis TaxID=2484974 RepID=A0A5F1Z1J6_9LEPT|nr:c-type cytochrome [Leptospira gomenensis]TGK35478.1 cytochrome C [Leptospira gomenensis]TGK40630.1 cytochrome C [Leptospira gomenensis]TGK46308.1 cytochrome C [Leptospira gomenensis]TGK66443.1 cytochrome C [Leptospira gomenensis]
MKTKNLLLILSICILANCSKNDESSRIKRGEKLVRFGSCADCHTSKSMTPQGPVPNSSKHLAGYLETNKLPDYKSFKGSPWLLFNGDLTATVGPWGVTFAKNLTPDKETGIGGWTEEHFIQTVRTQKRMGVGRNLLPPMAPIMGESLNSLTDEELKDIFAYLKSIPPVKNKVPEPILN